MNRRTFVSRLSAGVMAAAMLGSELMGRRPRLEQASVVASWTTDDSVREKWFSSPNGPDSFEVYIRGYADIMARKPGEHLPDPRRSRGGAL